MNGTIELISRVIAAILLTAMCAAVAVAAPKLVEVFGMWLFAGAALLLMFWALLSPTE